MLNRNQRRIAHLPHDVYKAYDANERLLYVGISVNVFKRLGEHRRYAPWYYTADHIDVVRHPSRSSARAEEARCIREDAPHYNVTNESAYGCVVAGEFLEEFTMWRDGNEWFIDAA